MTTAGTIRVPAGTLAKMRVHAAQSVEAAATKCHHDEDDIHDWERARLTRR